MPIPQVTCCICNKLVNKAQTLSIGDGRACRSHPETTQRSKDAQQHLKDTAKKKAEALEKARKKPWKMENSADILQPKCFCCQKPGIRQDLFFLEMLKCSEKFEITYGRPHNPFDQEDAAKAYGPMKGMLCLWIVPFDPKLRLHFHARTAAQFMGFAALCPDCCKKQGIKPGPKEEDINLNTLSDLSVCYEVFIKPEIKAMAVQEISERN